MIYHVGMVPGGQVLIWAEGAHVVVQLKYGGKVILYPAEARALIKALQQTTRVAAVAQKKNKGKL